ncbi:uncharacterized protein YndB with AHSA1/START domain [Povalibacter uvarum]|uniref:Uncharacterized protein YndB with AHSA1/START domain n=1 Tax=Povalibacter uvarum TaxID=732238 RepID=A0A841HLI9_9GAMM|nr:SRPBCC domain-containing protein [Povalibacter uvarum]MBB6092972.1 uncharacterized protein YndB with AHSA1/START domain [Povalibacter uvarum]
MPRRPNPVLSLAGLVLACFVAGVTFGDEAPGNQSASEATQSQTTEGYINAPLAEVWRIFTTADGLRTAGVGQAEVDLRVGGSIRSHDDPRAKLGDPETWVREILAYDPQRMLASHIRQAPARFPYRNELGNVWTVTYFTASGEDMTHVKIVVLGYRPDAASQALRQSLAEANRRTLDTVAKRYWPKCKLCTTEPAADAEK